MEEHVATFALISWPIVVFVLFAKLPLRSALIWSLLLAYLYLPEKFGINLPGLPPLQKTSIPALAVITALLIFSRRKAGRGAMSEDEVLLENNYRLFTWLFFGLAVGLLVNMGLTIATNRAPIIIGESFLPGLRPWDFVSMTSNTVFMMIPFFLGRQYLARPADHRQLLKCIVIAGLGYSLLFLVEIRLSPQFHRWVYGFHQHSFLQHIRDGYRPKLFLPHGLDVGFFLLTTVFAAFALARGKGIPKRSRWVIAAVWLLLMLLISKNLGATAITLVLLPLLWLSRRLAFWAVLVITLSFLMYPLVRQTGLVPVTKVAEVANSISADRAQSFVFRLVNEDRLLARAAQKPVSGWGGWGRARVYNEQGRDISVTDGLWIIILGERGWVGYLCFFGLLTLPLLIMPKVGRRKEVPLETIALALIMTGNIIYLIPNSTLSPIAWLMIGALAGFVQFDAKSADVTEARKKPRPSQPGYTRFPEPLPENLTMMEAKI